MYNVNLLLKINYQSKGSIRIFTVVCTYVSNIMSIKNCFIEARQETKPIGSWADPYLLSSPYWLTLKGLHI